MTSGATLGNVRASAYRIPTDTPESDGTFSWDATTIVVAEVSADGETGIGYTYGSAALARMICDELAPALQGMDALDVAKAWDAMSAALRNAGRPGAGMMAISAVDLACWDLKARLLGTPVTGVVGAAHEAVPIYGSGGFTSYSLRRIEQQLGEWVADGIPRVKMKVGRSPRDDPARLDAARLAIGDDAQLFVDANGAFAPRQAIEWAHRYREEWHVSWFEEPVTSDDVEGLRFVRDHCPPGIDVAAGEYGYLPRDFRSLLGAGAVDCVQADVTRCGGITGLLRVSSLCDTFETDLSGHCAPTASAHALCGVTHLRHLEYFHDHVRVEHLCFDGTLDPAGGCLRPDPSRPGLGIALKRGDIDRYRVA